MPRLEWVVAAEPDYRTVDEMSKHLDLPPIIVKILINRGLTDEDEIRSFIDPKLVDLDDPFDMPDMSEAIERIVDALRDNEKILVYGDYEADGITASFLRYLLLIKIG